MGETCKDEVAFGTYSRRWSQVGWCAATRRASQMLIEADETQRVEKCYCCTGKHKTEADDHVLYKATRGLFYVKAVARLSVAVRTTCASCSASPAVIEIIRNCKLTTYKAIVINLRAVCK